MIETTLNGKTKDIVQNNIEQLKQLFPEIVTEGKIDYDKLREILGEEIDDCNERYDFTWKGKHESIKTALSPSEGTLRPDKKTSKNWDSTENLYIEGDNLEVLKLLQKSYYGKIKMIYLDPPYNTGNDFVYEDNFTDNLKNYLEQDEEGFNVSSNPETSGRYHTTWLNMMYPRLKLARNLLTDDGVIFISIDDNEVVNLKKICDEIFGETNFEAQFYIKVRHENRILREDIRYQLVMEQVLCYSKSKLYTPNRLPKPDNSEKQYIYDIQINNEPNSIIDINGYTVEIYSSDSYDILEKKPGAGLLKKYQIRGSLISQSGSASEYYELNLRQRREIDGNGTLYKVINMGINGDGLGYRYIMQPEKEKSKNGFYFQGRPLKQKKNIGLPYPNYYDFVKEANNVGYEGEVEFKNGKKPLALMQKLFEIANICNDKNALVLDFFSGSATTAHALMKLNSYDNGKRKFIMIQLPEKINNKAYNQEYNNICEIGEERIRRSGDSLIEKHPDTDIDIGFKVFKLNSSNLTKWNPDVDNLEDSLISARDNIIEERSELDLVYEIMLKYGLELTLPVEEIKQNNYSFYSVGLGSLVICLDNHIKRDVAENIIKIKKELSPSIMRVVFKDNGFESDSDKTNIKEILRNNEIDEFITI